MTTKTKTDGRSKGLCQYDGLTRPKHFDGMLLTKEHLRAEQIYHREALKRLNRHLWGAGIVCGLEVRKTGGICIKVQPGLALDCDGNAIEVCKSVTIDLTDVCKKIYPDGCTPEDATPITKYLVLRYAEVAADPEPVLIPADECEPDHGTTCEASKYREGYCLEFRDDCPNPGTCGGADQEEPEGLLPTVLKLSRQRTLDVGEELERLRPDCMDAPPCPSCDCDDVAVGLAKVVVDCAQHTVEVECECRDYVWSPRLVRWLLCGVLGKIDKVPTDVTGLDESLPSAKAFIARPMRGLWDASAVLASRDRAGELQRELGNLASRVANLEKGTQPKGKGKE
jgi:hypothetical protein